MVNSQPITMHFVVRDISLHEFTKRSDKALGIFCCFFFWRGGGGGRLKSQNQSFCNRFSFEKLYLRNDR